MGKASGGIREKLRWLDPFTYVDEFVMPVVNPKGDSKIEFAVNLFFAAFFAFALYYLAGLLLSTEVPGAIVLSFSMVPALTRGDFILLHGVDAPSLNAQAVDVNFSIGGRHLKEYATTYCSFHEKYGDPGNILPCDAFLKSYIGGEITIDSFTTRAVEFNNGSKVEINKEGDIVLYYSDLSGKQIIHRAVAKIRAQDGIYVLTKGDSALNPVIDQDYPFNYSGNAITSYAIPASKVKGRILLKIPIIGYAKIIVFDDIPNLIFGCKDKGNCYFP